MSASSRTEPDNPEWSAIIYRDYGQPIELSAVTWPELRAQLARWCERLKPTDDISISGLGWGEFFSPGEWLRAIADSDLPRLMARIARQLKLANSIVRAVKAFPRSSVPRKHVDAAERSATRAIIMLELAAKMTPFTLGRKRHLLKSEELLRAAVAQLRILRQAYS